MASFLDTAKNLAYEFSGAGDIMRGSRELAKGNVAGGLGRLALGAAGFIPVVGTGARAALTGSRLARGSNFVQAATKTKPAQFIARPAQAASKTKPVQTIARPVQAAGRKTTQAITASKKLSTPLVGRGAKTKLGKFAAGATTPYAISRIISSATLKPNVAGADQPQAPNIFDAAQRSWEQTQLAASLMGTNVPKAGGGTPKAGGTGPGASVTPPLQELEPGYGPGPEDAGIPEIVVPPFGGGIGVGGGAGDTGTSEINTGGEESLMGGTGEMMVGTPGEVAKAGAQYGAGLAGIAAQNRLRDAGLRELFSQGMMGVRGTAADILGGRSAAIRGQGVTGVRRAFQTGLAQAAQDRIAEESALARTYGSEVAAGYQQAAQDAMDLAQRRSEAAARIRSLG